MKAELLDAKRSVVVVIDMQGRIMDMIHRPRLVIEATSRLMKLAELYAVPVLMTEQYPRGLGPTHPEIRAAYDELTTAKSYMEKESFGCCGEPAFEQALAELLPGVPVDQRQILITGVEAHVCVTQTVIELLRQGSGVYVCWDCVSGRGPEYRDYALKRMEQAGAVMINHESICFEWARDKNHPQFKATSNLLKGGQLS
jgi:nicotinamidase-related amidase